MRYALQLGCYLLSLSLSACGGEVLGIGSLVMQGLQMAGGNSTSPSGTKNSAPFMRPNNADEQRALDDLSSRAVSQSCIAGKEDPERAAAASPMERLPNSAPRQCGYRDVCLPGHARPVRMMICEKLGQSASAVPFQVLGTP